VAETVRAAASDTVPGPVQFRLELSEAEVEARFRWARRRGHVAWYWPDLPVDMWHACVLEVEHTTRLILGAVSLPVPLRPPAGAGARALGIAAFTSGMGPLLGFWIEEGIITAPPDVSTLLGLHLEHGRRRARRMEKELKRALDLLGAAGIRVSVVKAAHTATGYFPEPGTRPAADVDLVIDPRDAKAASKALRRAGYEPLKTRRRPWKSDWQPPGAPRTLRSLELTHGDNPLTIELHGTADRDFFGVRTIRFGPIDSRNTRHMPELHPAAHVLVQPWLTAYLAAHASEELHQLQLVRIVELAAVIRHDVASGALDWLELQSMIRWLDMSRFVFPAFELVERLLPGTVDPAALAEMAASATPRMRRVLGRIGPATAQRLEGTTLDERFIWSSGPVETVRRFAHMIWPTRGESSSLRQIYGARIKRLLQGRVRLRRDR